VVLIIGIDHLERKVAKNVVNLFC